MAVGQIDALELRIAYSAGNAAEGIKKLATSLGELKSSMSGIASGLEKIEAAIRGISNATKNGSGLSGVSKQVEQLSNNLADRAIPRKVADRAIPLKTEVQEALDRAIPQNPYEGKNVFGSVTEEGKGFENELKDINRAADALKAVVEDLAQKIVQENAVLWRQRDAWRELREQAKKAAAEQRELAKQKAAVQTSSKESEPSEWFTSIDNLFKKIWKVAQYRMLRGIITGISKGFAEGVQNMYQWSKALNGEFARSMDSIAKSATIMKNSLAVAFAPSIEALAPVFANIANWAAQAATAVSRFTAILLGSDHYYSVSTGFAQEYAAATGKATQKLRTLLKFDEINRLEKANKGGGGKSGGVNTGGMFKRESLDKDLSNLSFLSRLQLALEDWGFTPDSITKLFSGDNVLGKFITAVGGITILGAMFKKGGVGKLALTFLGGLIGFEVGDFLVNALGIKSVFWGEIVRALGTAAGVGIAASLLFSPGVGLVLSIATLASLIIGSFKSEDKGEAMKTGWENLKDKIRNIFTGGASGKWQSGKGFFELLIDTILNFDITQVKSNAKQVVGTISSKDLVEHPAIQIRGGPILKEAAGGFVDNGQMFIAREAGPELVGRIGGKTAVANNDQIVEAVARGVASAVNKEVLLIQEQNSILRTIAGKSGGITTGSIASAFERENRRAGTSIISVGG